MKICTYIAVTAVLILTSASLHAMDSDSYHKLERFWGGRKDWDFGNPKSSMLIYCKAFAKTIDPSFIKNMVEDVNSHPNEAEARQMIYSFVMLYMDQNACRESLDRIREKGTRNERAIVDDFIADLNEAQEQNIKLP